MPHTHQGNRLLFWQQEALDKFNTRHPGAQLSFQTLVEVFRICHLHDTELIYTTVPIVKGCVDMDPAYWTRWNSEHPNACLPFISTEGRDIDDTELGIWYCSKCEEIRVNIESNASIETDEP